MMVSVATAAYRREFEHHFFQQMGRTSGRALIVETLETYIHSDFACYIKKKV